MPYIDYIDTHCNYDAMLARMYQMALLKELIELQKQLTTITIEMRKLNRELDAGLAERGLEPGSIEAYRSGPRFKYSARRADLERTVKEIVTVKIPALEAKLGLSHAAVL